MGVTFFRLAAFERVTSEASALQVLMARSRMNSLLYLLPNLDQPSNGIKWAALLLCD